MTSVWNLTCGKCGCKMEAESEDNFGFREREDVKCPECNFVVQEVTCSRVWTSCKCSPEELAARKKKDSVQKK